MLHIQNLAHQPFAIRKLLPKAVTSFPAMLWAGLLLSALNPATIQAADGNWNVDNAGTWSTAGNWNPASVPGTTAGDTVGLTNDITAARTITIDTTSRTVGTLNIGDPTPPCYAFTLAASGGATLTFNNNGSGAALNKANSATNISDTISAPIILNDNLTVTLAKPVTISGGISESGGARSRLRGLTPTPRRYPSLEPVPRD